MRYEFPVELTREDDGSVTVAFDGLPGTTWGATEAEALRQAADALVTVLSTYVSDNEPVPRPKPAHGRPLVSVNALEAAKLGLHDAMLATGMSNLNLAQRLGTDETAVQRLRDPLRRSHIGTVEAALAVLGRRLAVDVSEAA